MERFSSEVANETILQVQVSGESSSSSGSGSKTTVSFVPTRTKCRKMKKEEILVDAIKRL